MAWQDHFEPTVARALAERMRSPEPGSFAAFDADGTLWEGDIGEVLLKELSDEGRLPGQKGDIYAEYETKRAQDTRAAYIWAVQLMAGMGEDEVTKRSNDLARRWERHVRPAMRALIEALSAAGVPSYVMSGSNAWCIRAAVPLLSVDPRRSFGIQSRVQQGVLTTEILEPVTYGAGKMVRLRTELGANARPLVAAGDAITDLEMLEAAHLPMVVKAQADPPNAMQGLARERGYLIQSFPR